jgi:uncharacterized phage protein (TIGR01671 family)
MSKPTERELERAKYALEYYIGGPTNTVREILFRGKRKDNGEWVEGSGINTQYDIRGEKHIYIGVLISSETHPKMQTIAWYEVIPETVGEYTGFTDKNDKKVFEGDICIADSLPFVVEWNTYECGFYWRDSIKVREFFGGIAKSSNIIGNRHDNPELLSGEK